MTTAPDRIELTVTEANEHGYIPARVLASGECAGVMRMVYTAGLFVGLTDWGYRTRFCYPTIEDAIRALAEWDGHGDPPGPWIKEKGAADRSNPKNIVSRLVLFLLLAALPASAREPGEYRAERPRPIPSAYRAPRVEDRAVYVHYRLNGAWTRPPEPVRPQSEVKAWLRNVDMRPAVRPEPAPSWAQTKARMGLETMAVRPLASLAGAVVNLAKAAGPPWFRGPSGPLSEPRTARAPA